MSNQISVLVVDDNPINRQYFSMALIKAGFIVELAESGFDAIQLATEIDFDIILIDIRMPEMDGYEATSKIKLLENHVKTPIIAISAENLHSDKESLFHQFLLKPVSPKVLKKTIDEHCKTSVVEKLVFNQESAMKFAYDDIDILKKIIDMFTQDLPNQLSQLETLIQHKNKELSCDLIHKIRGSCKACGADSLDKHLQLLSNTIKGNLMIETLEQFNTVKEAVKDYLKSSAELRHQ